MKLHDHQRAILSEIGEHILTRDDVNSIAHRIIFPEKEGMDIGAIHICVNNTKVRIFRQIKANEIPETVAIEIRMEIKKRLDRIAWLEVLRRNY